jgi:hypothetical protein
MSKTVKKIIQCSKCPFKWESSYADRRKTSLCASCLQSGDANPNWKGGHRYWSQGRRGKDKDGLSWKTQQRLAQVRGGGKCEDCGKTDQENGRRCDTDHVVPYRISFSHHLDNLRIRCQACHHREEAKRPDVWGGQVLTPPSRGKPRLKCLSCSGSRKKLNEDQTCPSCLRHERNAKIIELFSEGMDYYGIAPLVGLSWVQVRTILVSCGQSVPKRNPPGI